MSNISSVDYIKLLMSFMVVAIHTRPFEEFNNTTLDCLFDSVVNVAVPYFFIASGFFLFRSVTNPLTGEGKNRCRKYIKKIIRLYCVWTILYLPLSIYGFYAGNLPFGTSILLFLRNFLFVGENYYSWPLWYLLGLIVAVGIIYLLLLRRVNVYCVFLIALLAGIAGAMIEYLYGSCSLGSIDLYYKVFATTRNGFFVGFLCVTLGMLTAYDKIKTHMILLWFMLISGLIGSYYHVWLSPVLSAFALFAIIIRCDFGGVEAAKFFRSMSVIIYFIHMFWVAIIELCFQGKSGSLGLFVLVSCLSVVTSFILLRFRESYFYRLCFY